MKRPRNTVKQLLRPTALLLCAALLTPVACKKGDEEESAPTPVVYVQAAHPEQGSIAEQITADALLAPLAQAAIQPKITAPVKKFYVQRGARVKAGQLLAVLENKDLAAAALDNKGRNMSNWNRGGNTPLYGVGLGILALLFATWAVHRWELGIVQPPTAQASRAD